MKEYIKNKDFIPEKFYNKMELDKNKRENEIIILFLIINLILFPMTIRNNKQLQNKDKEITKYAIVKEDDQSLNKITKFINNIFEDGIEEARISNEKGEIIVNNFEEVSKLSDNNNIKIDNINLNGSQKYELGVSSYD